MFKITRIPAIISLLVFLLGCSKTASFTKDIILMDTFVRIEIKGFLGQDLKARAAGRAAHRMKELEKKFNYFLKDSELSRINNLKKGERFILSEEMFKVLKVSREVGSKTDGVFDVTVGPLSEIWFSTKKGSGLSGGQEINAAKEKMGLNNWALDEIEKAVIIKKEGVKINLGGIAKGFIVDEGIRVLKASGINNALINAGGDIYCIGGGSLAGGWRIGISDPRNSREVIATFRVRDKGVATSGGYERFRESDKKKFTHIIDPRTGHPVEKILRSVTVVANDCVTADALATALYVLNPHQGLLFIEGIDGAECIVIDENGRFFVSSGLQGRISLRQANRGRFLLS